jgi:hypothetical protein
MNENEMNLLENRLHSWQPRRPSPRVKRRLFGPTAQREAITLSLRWIAPAAACLLLAFTILYQESAFPNGTSARQPIIGLISSNLSYTNPQGHNSVAPPSFEWTNPGGFTSNISPFSPARMN